MRQAIVHITFAIPLLDEETAVHVADGISHVFTERLKDDLMFITDWEYTNGKQFMTEDHMPMFQVVETDDETALEEGEVFELAEFNPTFIK
jgi:hypothetical protein